MDTHTLQQLWSGRLAVTQCSLTAPDIHFPTRLPLRLMELLATPCSTVTMQYKSSQEELYCQRGHEMTRDKAEPSSSRSWREDEPCLSFVFNMNYSSSSSSSSSSGMYDVGLSSFAFPSLPPSTPFLSDHHHSSLPHPFTYHLKQCPQTNHHIRTTVSENTTGLWWEVTLPAPPPHHYTHRLSPLPPLLVGGPYFTRSTYNNHGHSNLVLITTKSILVYTFYVLLIFYSFA